MFCTECGEKNRSDRKFCTNCGAPLKDYTKPRENLLMPEDIEKAQAKAKTNNISKNFILPLIISAILTLASTIAIFFVKQPVKNILVIVSICLFILLLLILFIRKIKIKQITNKTE